MVDTDIIVVVEKNTKSTMRRPSKFHVVFYNDDVTTVEFVIDVLMKIFHKTFDDAQALCIEIHENGKGIAGTYGLEIATQKREETIILARMSGFPLRCEVEEV